AAENRVSVGAHPSYPDREHFGRKTMDISARELAESLLVQIGGLEKVVELFNLPLDHIKPHGALYNDIAINRGLARDFLKAISAYREKAYLYVPYGSIIAEEALASGFGIKYEAFADRNYNLDLSLVSRSEQNALIEDPRSVLGHLLHMVIDKKVVTVTGEAIKIEADTFCIHGDGPTSLQILAYLSQALQKHKISLKK
ncbi:MAG TPA: LamB/YcsF family protein, partial [Arenibacter sp.]|nr:LamB/YcsF family protein [Arenibacter sp.]